jgi:ubiquinone/menaquinone biosynthesis C-methylase UbiE
LRDHGARIAQGFRLRQQPERQVHMSNDLAMAAQLAGQSLRFGWYFALGRALDWRVSQLGGPPRYKPRRPVPSLQDLLAAQAQLLLSDALNVRDGLYPAMDDDASSLPRYLARIRSMFADVPNAHARRADKDTATVRQEPAAAEVPDYYAQDFHFQTGGYLTEDSARLYDVQVETLFMGAAGPMRRAALAPVAHFMAGRDQRHVALLDVACGTGRFLRQVRLAFPAMRLTGLDLSRPYLDEARRQLDGLRGAELIEAAAERMPLESESVDIATSIFLFHELPPDVRRAATAEIARVLKPGGMFVLLDSLQMGDRPGWDGLIEAFPERFHEPYYRHYAIDDLDGMLSAAGLEPELTTTPFLSKLMVRRKR